MADRCSKVQRSKNMAAIKSKNTKPEIAIRSLLFSAGYRYRLYTNRIPGHPDIWMKKYNTAIFIHGCFWHRHQNCKYAYIPKTRTEFWNNKFYGNIKRDDEVKRELLELNIKCLVIWECTINKSIANSDARDKLLKDIKFFLHSDQVYAEL